VLAYLISKNNITRCLLTNYEKMLTKLLISIDCIYDTWYYRAIYR